MAVSRLIAISLAISGFAASAGRAAPAEPSPVVQGVSELLQLGQRYSPRNLAEARKQHERLSSLDGYDARAEYAYAVILIRQHASDDALAALDRVLAERPGLLAAWRAKVWTQMSTRKYPAAVRTMRAAAAAMAQAGKDAADAGERDETAQFFGRMFAYLESRTGQSVPAEELRKSKQSVQSKLGDDRAGFAAGEEAMTAQLVKAQEQVKQSEAATTAQFAEQEAAVRQQLKKVDKAETDLDFKTEKLQTDTKTQLEDLNKQADGIQAGILRTQSRINFLDLAIAEQQMRITLQNSAMRPTGQSVNANVLVYATQALNQLQNGLQQLAAQRLGAAGELVVLNNQFADIVATRDGLVDERSQAAAGLKSQARQLKRKEKELDRAQKAAADAQIIPASKSRKVAEHQQAFASFEPFPFDAEKARVGHWFGK